MSDTKVKTSLDDPMLGDNQGPHAGPAPAKARPAGQVREAAGESESARHRIPDRLMDAFFEDLTFGESQTLDNITLVPIFKAAGESPEYTSLGKAMSQGGLAIGELGSTGSVPDLVVNNATDENVMLLDGEELLGAKQNRVLNTTVMIPARSRVVVPVSCTERGRWAYNAPVFSESDSMLHHRARLRNSGSVHAELRARGLHRSHQGEVWEDIQNLQAAADVASPTHALHDVYKARRAQLADLEKAFRPQEGQVGSVFLVDGRVIGLEAVSRPEVYTDVHHKLVRSYGLEAQLRSEPRVADDIESATQTFLERLPRCTWESYAGVGGGEDFRTASAGMIGSALVVDKVPVHVALFDATQNDSRIRRIRSGTGSPGPMR